CREWSRWAARTKAQRPTRLLERMYKGYAPMLRKRTTAVVLAGMIAVSGGGVLAGSHATQAAAKHTAAAKAKPVAARKAKSRLAVRFLVTAVQDTTITAETRAGRAETIITTPTTTFRVQGSTTPGTLTD